MSRSVSRRSSPRRPAIRVAPPSTSSRISSTVASSVCARVSEIDSPPSSRASEAAVSSAASSCGLQRKRERNASNALAASRRSAWKRSIRSRASGGIRGDSTAGPSAATMSSFALRATCTTRAMSTWRSSIGGRPSARTTAAESPGSLSRRTHASTSRALARSKNAPAVSTPPALPAGGGNAILETATA